MREACLGRLPARILGDMAYLTAATIPVCLLGIYLMKKRLVK
jgi:hypothetical protein